MERCRRGYYLDHGIIDAETSSERTDPIHLISSVFMNSLLALLALGPRGCCSGARANETAMKTVHSEPSLRLALVGATQAVVVGSVLPATLAWIVSCVALSVLLASSARAADFDIRRVNRAGKGLVIYMIRFYRRRPATCESCLAAVGAM